MCVCGKHHQPFNLSTHPELPAPTPSIHHRVVANIQQVIPESAPIESFTKLLRPAESRRGSKVKWRPESHIPTHNTEHTHCAVSSLAVFTIVLLLCVVSLSPTSLSPHTHSLSAVFCPVSPLYVCLSLSLLSICYIVLLPKLSHTIPPMCFLYMCVSFLIFD